MFHEVLPGVGISPEDFGHVAGLWELGSNGSRMRNRSSLLSNFGPTPEKPLRVWVIAVNVVKCSSLSSTGVGFGDGCCADVAQTEAKKMTLNRRLFIT
jgi:hypothetical protein